MATITRRQSTKPGARSATYQAKIRSLDASISRSFARKDDALTWATLVEANLRSGKPAEQDIPAALQKVRKSALTEASPVTPGTVADLIKRYEKRVLPNKKPSTQRSQKEQLAWWSQRLGALRLDQVTTARLVECRDELAETRAPATVNRYIAAMGHAFSLAAGEWELVDRNPFTRLKLLTEPRGRTRFLSPEERDRLLQECKQSPDLYTAVVVSLATGVRRGELMGLRWPDVDLKRGRFTLRDTKNGSTRAVHLAGLALELMQKRAKVRRLDSDLVFPGRKNPQKPLDMINLFRTTLRRADIHDFRWHDLRHTAASYLAMNGATLAEIAEVLGHRTLSMVARYAHLSDSHTSSVVERMNRSMFSGEQS